MIYTYNIFISHSWEYTGTYEKLCNLLNERNYFLYRNHSVPKDNPIHTNGSDKELKLAITNKMRNCHVILILAGKYSTYSKWIGKEIEIAQQGFMNKKPIIGIKPRANTQVSLLVKNNADVMVNWNTNSIVEAIRTYSI